MSISLSADPVGAADSAARRFAALPHTSVSLDDALWSERQRVNRGADVVNKTGQR